MTWLDDAIAGAARVILNAGSELAARGGLNFASPLKATDNAGADRSDVTLDYASLNGAAVMAILPAATNASAGKMTAAQVSALENAEVATERTGTVDLSAAQAWADLGAVLPIAVSTTTFYELSLQASWPDHTHSGEVVDDADSVSATVQVAVTRNASTGITVEQRNGGSSWDLGRVLFRAVDGGSGAWKLQVERDAPAADATTTATVTATVRVLSSQAWSGETATSWVDPDGATVESRIAALEAKPFGTVTTDGPLALGIQKITGGDTYTLPALSAATGQQKEVVLLLLIAVDATITADGSDEVILDDNTSTGPSVLVPAGTRSVTFIDDGTAGVWIPSLALAAP